MSITLKLLNDGFEKKYLQEPEKRLNESLNEDTTYKAGPFEFSSNLGSRALDTVDKTVDKVADNIEPIAKAAKFVVPLLADDASEKEEIKEKEVFHNDNGQEYDIIERSKTGKNALLNKGNKWIVAWNCPESNEGSWGQGHYFFDEKDAREVWQDKYLDESFNDLEEASYEDDDIIYYVYSNEDAFDDAIDCFSNKNQAISYAKKYSQKNNVDTQVILAPALDLKLRNPDAYFANEDTFGIIWKSNSLEEELNDIDYDDFKSAIYNALSNVIFKYSNKYRDNVSKHQIESALEWFELHFMDDDDLDGTFEECLNILTEAGMSDEDRHDSEILRNIYKKINGKQITNKTLSPEEKEIISKYGLDAWGYRGDTKVVTDKGRKNVINDSEFKRGFGSRNAGFVGNKINYADRARKIDDRDYAQNINSRKGWNQSFDDAEREHQQKELTKNVDKMKYSLRDRKYHQSKLDNADSDLSKRLDDIDKDYINSINRNRSSRDDQVSWASNQVDNAQKRIDQILDKHKVKESLHKLCEAEMSPEDKADSDLLRSIYKKIQNRSNARLTPEEEEVVKKYNLRRTRDNLTTNSSDYGYGANLFDPYDQQGHIKHYHYGHGSASPKINYADKARKLDKRDYAKSVEKSSGRSFDDKERNLQREIAGKDVNDMKYALQDRKYYGTRIDTANKDYTDFLIDADKNRTQKIDQAKQSHKDQIDYHKRALDKANKDIKGMLKKESLKEASEKRVVKGLSGEKNKEILDSVIGQISDGIWENSPGMDGYWLPVTISYNGDIIIDNKSDISYGDKWVKNKYYYMSDDEVRRFFANKIKQISQEYLNDNNLNPYKGWNAESDEICDYLDRNSGVTIGDAFLAYQALK